VVLGGKTVRERPRRTFLDQIWQVLKKGQVKSTFPKPASVYEELDVSRGFEGCM
jgi:hypothetical protein